MSWRYGYINRFIADLANSGELKSARRIKGTGKRPAAIIVRMAEVQNLRQAVEDTKTCTECRKERNAGKPPARCTHREQTADEAGMAEALGVPA